MSPDRRSYERVEQALLDAEGVEAVARWVDLDRLGGRLRVLEAGSGPAVLMVPGVMTGGAVFASLVRYLPDFRCIMIDRPGVGLSPLADPPPTDIADFERVGDQLLVDVLDGLGLDRAHVVATSQGAWSAYRSLAAHSERFVRMVGLAFQLGARVPKLPLSMRIPPIPFLTPKRVPANRWLVKKMLASTGMRSAIKSGKFSDELADWMAALLRHTNTFRNDSLHSPRPVEHSVELLARVEAPVHLFWGDDDLFGGEASAIEFASKLPSATVQMVPGAGHAPWIDEPELAVAAIRGHLLGEPNQNPAGRSN